MNRPGLARALVATQIVLLVALVLVPHGTWWTLTPVLLVLAIALCVLGLAITALGLLGLGSALTANPIPKQHAALATTGIYGLARHPVYTGLLVAGSGLVVIGASLWHVALWSALLVLLAVKARWEERMLLQVHPEYAEYAARVGRFVPWLGRIRSRD